MPDHKDTPEDVITANLSLNPQSGILHTGPFAEDVYNGLTASPKYLFSKYFYDKKGDKLFQQIMRCPEYYLTNCEKEILEHQSGSMLDIILKRLSNFDVVGLGAGDCYKSIHLLNAIQQRGIPLNFYPIDISPEITEQLERNLPLQLPGIKLKGLTGDYLQMLKVLNKKSSRPKLILFLGSSIGNMTIHESTHFFGQLRQLLNPKDLVLTGFDLKKHPQIILNAYNDSQGITRNFNLNLLHRINRELGADFDLAQFDHFPAYDPATGTCKSYLISLCRQIVHIKKLRVSIPFENGEYIFMERSQKYTLQQINNFASETNFSLIRNFMDSKAWFTDSLWVADE